MGACLMFLWQDEGHKIIFKSFFNTVNKGRDTARD